MPLQKRIVIHGRLQRDGPELDVLMRARGFRVYGVEAESELVDVVGFSQPDAAIVVGPPHRPFLSRLVAASQSNAQTLIVVLWPGAPVEEAVSLLDMGVDYVALTYQPDWLGAQIRASLRRLGRERSAPNLIDLDYLRIDLQQRTVTVNAREVPLTRTEFDVLRVLAER